MHHRTWLLIAGFSFLGLASAFAVETAPEVRAEREAAITWGMEEIAIRQAEDGDMQGAKQTLNQIRESGPKTPANVSAVWFNDGRPSYQVMPASFAASCTAADLKSPGWAKRDSSGTLYLLAHDRTPDQVPPQVPEGLPANYLDADPAHGAVVDFVDDSDSRGVRVTSRRYADGYSVIETPNRKS